MLDCHYCKWFKYNGVTFWKYVYLWFAYLCWSSYHYRDKSGLERDTVIHLRNGIYGLIEIKLGGDRLISDGVTTLNKLSSNIDASKMKAPAFKMLLVGVGEMAYKRSDGIYIVPLSCLKY